MELLYVVCQLAAAQVCEEHRAMLITDNPLACVYGAPAELAQLTHPGWRVSSWRCNPRREAIDPAAPAPAVSPAAFTE